MPLMQICFSADDRFGRGTVEYDESSYAIYHQLTQEALSRAKQVSKMSANNSFVFKLIEKLCSREMK